MDQDMFYEQQFYNYLDELKFLFFPNKWNTKLLDFSKNELLAMIFIYRKKSVNMSEIADYLMSPLNTATGVINRLDKKNIIDRIRDENDKRIVNISLTNEGIQLFNSEKEEILLYFKKVYTSLSEEERITIFNVFTKVINILNADKDIDKSKISKKKIRKITIE